MLQILLAFLAVSIIAASGLGLMEQLSLQQIMTDQRENGRRLDVAAEAIQGRLVTMPGRDGVFAPAPQNRSDGWSYMPAGVGGINATVDGVPFVYCPIATETGTSNFEVKSPNGSSYGVQVQAGVVVGSELGTTRPIAAGLSAYRPVAFIIAAGRGSETPPDCTAVRERNGRPFVEGGLVKLVSMPAGAQVMGTIGSGTSDIYVSATGDGNGSLNDPASLDDAVRHWVNFKPVAMTVHLVTNVSVDNAAAWSSFANALSTSPSRLVIEGNGHSLSAPGIQVGIPARFGLNNVEINGPTFVIGQGDEMSTSGNVILQPTLTGSGLYVQQGGRLAVSGGTLRIAGAAQNGVESSGDVTISQGAIAGISGMSWSVGLVNGGRLQATDAVIGDQSSRTVVAGLAVAGTWSVASDAASRVAASAGGICWASTRADDLTFKYSLNGSGASSAVQPYTGPEAVADPEVPGSTEAYYAYRREIEEREQAKRTNRSNFTCI